MDKTKKDEGAIKKDEVTSEESDKREKKLTDLILEKVKKKDKSLSLGAMLVEAGYTIPEVKETSATSIAKIKEGEGELIELMDTKRRRLLEFMNDAKMRSAKIGEQAKVFDILNKNLLLATGQETERHGYHINVQTYGDSDPLTAALKQEEKIIDGEITYNK
jgi:hypothetical protein